MSRDLFEYAVLRAVPHVERGEQLNVGVLLYCQQRDFLAVAWEVDEPRLRVLAPGLDLDELRAHLQAVERVCAGGPAAGAAGRRTPGERFRWLVAPRSTVVQPGPVHTGLTDDPAAQLEHLRRCLVSAPQPPGAADRPAAPGDSGAGEPHSGSGNRTGA